MTSGFGRDGGGSQCIFFNIPSRSQAFFFPVHFSFPSLCFLFFFFTFSIFFRLHDSKKGLIRVSGWRGSAACALPPIICQAGLGSIILPPIKFLIWSLEGAWRSLMTEVWSKKNPQKVLWVSKREGLPCQRGGGIWERQQASLCHRVFSLIWLMDRVKQSQRIAQRPPRPSKCCPLELYSLFRKGRWRRTEWK